MSLRTRTLLIIGTIFVALMIAVGLTSRFFILKGFESLEKEHVRQSVLQVSNELESAISRLNSIAGDWGPWDDTYHFMQDSNSEYISNNLSVESLLNLEIDFMLFVDVSAQLKHGVAVDPAGGRGTSLPQDFWQTAFPQGVLAGSLGAEKKTSGILVYRNTPLMFAARKIEKSDFKGPARGVLVVGKFLDPGEVERISKLSRVPLSVIPVSAGEMPPDVKSALAHISEAHPVAVLPLDEHLIAGYAVQKTVEEKPAFILKITTSRDIYNQGVTTLIYLLLVTLVICIIFIVTTVLLIDNSVISPVTAISKSVASIGGSEDASRRLRLANQGELGQLELSINTMLDRIQEANAKIKKLEGLLPICTECKKIRDDNGFWQRVEEYVQDRAHVRFTHGICPECAKKIYPGHDIYPKNN